MNAVHPVGKPTCLNLLILLFETTTNYTEVFCSIFSAVVFFLRNAKKDSAQRTGQPQRRGTNHESTGSADLCFGIPLSL